MVVVRKGRDGHFVISLADLLPDILTEGPALPLRSSVLLIND